MWNAHRYSAVQHQCILASRRCTMHNILARNAQCIAQCPTPDTLLAGDVQCTMQIHYCHEIHITHYTMHNHIKIEAVSPTHLLSSEAEILSNTSVYWQEMYNARCNTIGTRDTLHIAQCTMYYHILSNPDGLGFRFRQGTSSQNRYQSSYTF